MDTAQDDKFSWLRGCADSLPLAPDREAYSKVSARRRVVLPCGSSHTAMKPCPCGYFGDAKRECRCSPVQVERYRNRISGPLLDRIDIHVEVPAVQYQEMSSNELAEASAVIRERVQQARDLQRIRFGGNSKVRTNARMTSKLLKTHCQLGGEAEGMLKMAMTELNLSARAYDRILKVGRTIADLEMEESIAAHHIAEAIQYRTLDRNMWG